MVTTTHDLHIVEELADTVFVFGQDKSIVGAGATREPVAAPPARPG